MTDGRSDDRMRQLIVDAYQEMDLPVSLWDIESAARSRPRRRAIRLTAVAATLLAITIGSSVYITGGTRSQAGPVGASSGASLSAAPEAQPSVSAAAGTSECDSRSLDGLKGMRPDGEPPVLRFDVSLIPSRLSLRLYADEWSQVACWVEPDDSTGRGWAAWVSDPSKGGKQIHPAGKLSNLSTAASTQGVWQAGFAFGRMPPGTTRVEIHFPDGTTTEAQLAGEWYIAWATGDAAQRFSDVSKVVAQTPAGQQTLEVD